MVYVDGFVIPIPKKKLKSYRVMARLGCKVWMQHGALDYHECVGDDLDTKFGTPFLKLVGAKRGETVLLAWITYKSKAHRDKVNAKAMKDPRLQAMMGKPMPFDMARMSMGGFKSIVDA